MSRQIASQTPQQKSTATPWASGLLKRKHDFGPHTIAGGELEAYSKKKRLGLQTKLKVNEPGDIYEQEAERIAGQVMAMPANSKFAAWINVNLRFLWGVTWMAGYECYSGGLLERVWACGPNDLATTFWCVPGVDIRLCPSYFRQSPKERSTTLIHEWVHKYGCNFDLGYEHESDYPQNWTVTQLLSADSFSNFIRDVS
jgi:hypothetical protein